MRLTRARSPRDDDPLGASRKRVGRVQVSHSSELRRRPPHAPVSTSAAGCPPGWFCPALSGREHIDDRGVEVAASGPSRRSQP
jgi:hypothetical protein